MIWSRATVDEDGEVSPNRFGERIPDSPALPAVAKVLAETPDMDEALRWLLDFHCTACTGGGVGGLRHRSKLTALLAALEDQA